MKRMSVLIALVVASCTAATAVADIQLTRIKLETDWTYRSGNGGEFRGNIIGDPITIGGTTLGSGYQWLTFCMERDEGVTNGKPQYWAVVNTAMVSGGTGGRVADGNPLFTTDTDGDGIDDMGQPHTGDPLDERTAYLFTLFAQGKLEQYAYSGSVDERKHSAGALQQAIWYIEEEVSGFSNDDVGTLAQEFYNIANSASANGWSGLGNVRVLNLYKNYKDGTLTKPSQDILIIYVPVPGAVVLAGFGLAGVAWIRRRLA